MKKTTIIATIALAIFSNKFYSQNYDMSGISVAIATGFGFSDITSKRLNGGAYGKVTTQRDFKYKPLYWSAAFAAKRRLHEFGIEYEQLDYKSEMNYGGGVNIQYNDKQSLKNRYFNFYYKFLFPIEFKKFTPYLKAALNINIYTYRYDRTWTNSYGPNGSDFSTTTGLGGKAFSVMAGTNYNITDYFSVFTEMGYGPIFCKIGTRIGWFPN